MELGFSQTLARPSKVIVYRVCQRQGFRRASFGRAHTTPRLKVTHERSLPASQSAVMPSSPAAQSLLDKVNRQHLSPGHR